MALGSRAIRRRCCSKPTAALLPNSPAIPCPGRTPIVTAYLKNGGTLEKAAQLANHASTRTTQLYDRRAEELTLDEVERILV